MAQQDSCVQVKRGSLQSTTDLLHLSADHSGLLTLNRGEPFGIKPGPFLLCSRYFRKVNI